MFKTTTTYYFSRDNFLSKIEASATPFVTDGKTDGTHTIDFPGPQIPDFDKGPWTVTRTWTDIESANAWKTIIDTILTEYEAASPELQALRTEILASIGADIWTTTVEEIVTT
jgi:hypothetical protein